MVKSNEERIIELLLSTGRIGMDELLRYMQKNGFFTSPCSSGYHLAKKGGLAEHSLNVLGIMQDMSFLLCKGPEILSKEQQDSIIICSLLHDLGKIGDYEKPVYVPNMIKSRKMDENGEYPLIQSESKPFEVNKDLIPVDHEIRSVKIASKFIELTEEEELAILWHNGLYGNFKYQIQNKETPLYLLLHFSDMWASRIVEVENQPE